MKALAPLAILAFGSLYAADLGTVEEIVAKCNGDIVTRGDLQRSRQQLISDLRENGMTGPVLERALDERGKNILRDRIDQLLLTQKAKDLDISVDSDVTKRMAAIQSDSGIADPDKFHDYIKEKSGQSFEDFRDDMKKSLLTQRVIRQEVSEKIPIKHEELEKYYNEHKSEFVREERVYLREILISTENKDAAGVAAAEKKAKDLVSRARRGERFAEMARDNSDAVTAKGMGELPAFKKGELAKNLEDAVWNQPKGYVTDPIRASNGFLILRVEEHQKAGQAELAEVENEIMDKLFQPRMEPAVRQYLTKLRQDAFLQIKADYIDTGAAPGKDTSWVDPAQLKPETVTKEEVSTKVRRKRLLWTVPIPGTETQTNGTSSSQ
ncbi:MAG TPA: peptidylprolyl isomerase [Bryobacteraceae bacterium]|nr:peptidylprolyl isomerase [Bryobacteraceae bacterium]